jgi:hypothetical protein
MWVVLPPFWGSQALWRNTITLTSSIAHMGCASLNLNGGGTQQRACAAPRGEVCSRLTTKHFCHGRSRDWKYYLRRQLVHAGDSSEISCPAIDLQCNVLNIFKTRKAKQNLRVDCCKSVSLPSSWGLSIDLQEQKRESCDPLTMLDVKLSMKINPRT